MRELLIFFTEFVIVSAVFFMCFHIIRNHTTATFKRYYLLAWMTFSIVLPLTSIESNQGVHFTVDQVIEPSFSRPQPLAEIKEYHDELRSEGVIPYSKEAPDLIPEKGFSMDWSLTGIIVYVMVAGFFLFRVAFGLFQIFRLKKNATMIDASERLFQVSNSKFSGASFFGWIFIGQQVGDERDVIIRHEKLHRDLFHSLDILVSHIYCALFWINPFSWILKRYVGLNTEFEVDARMLSAEKKTEYANMLLSLTQGFAGSKVMNHFGAFHLKSRILALSKVNRHKKWVSVFSMTTILGLFFLISCESTNSSEVMNERLGDVKTITTRFISHQSDTKQKTGKIVAIASFAPDGSLEELVEQTTYPYDREFEVKKVFWESPETSGIPFVMDGLSLGPAEKSILYGNDWPKAYFKHLYARSQSRDMPWGEIITTDDETLPTEIQKKYDRSDRMFSLGMPDVTEFFEYEGQKVVRVLSQSSYPNIQKDDEHYKRYVKMVEDTKDENMAKILRERLKLMNGEKGDKFPTEEYTYDGALMTSVKVKDYERKFYYENGLLIKSEYFKSEILLNTRVHYYKNSLKDRTEIFNRYNEPEYTITYEYEFWE